MYERYYGLRELPFDLTPNPRYLFLTQSHREALSNLQYGISGRRGVTLLIGEAGTGKTTLVRSVLESEQRKSSCCIYLNNPMLTRAEFIEFLARAFDLSARAAGSKTALLFELEQVLRDRHSRGIITALLVDEAQALPLELLEEIRLLANIETDTDKLLPVVLAGQPQLAIRLNDPELRQLKQRVALRCELKPLDLKDTIAYVAGRVSIAGGDSLNLFTGAALELIHACSQGIPRTISVICDNALVSGFAAGERPVDRATVHEVCRDFDLSADTKDSRPTLPSEPQPALSAARPPARRPAERHARPPAATLPGTMLFASFAKRRRFSFFRSEY
jgi:general secretion pathway protein A